MKVRIQMTVEIDPAAWTANYGVRGAAAIRDDVREYVASTVAEQLRSVDVLLES
jgi:hypothetical protein